MSETKIPWATHTVNWLAGCSKASEGCLNCYAENMTARLATMPNKPARYSDGVIEDRKWTGHISFDHEALKSAFEGMRNAKKPRRVFCGSMSDLFHENAPRESLLALASEIIEVQMAEAKGAHWPHILMLLTKRPLGMLSWQQTFFPEGLPSWVWVGATVENQKRADERMPLVLGVKAGLHFASCEPMLGPVDVPNGTEWVIIGGESGPRARPLEEKWVDDLVGACQEYDVPVMVKQWSSHGGHDKYDIPSHLAVDQKP